MDVTINTTVGELHSMGVKLPGDVLRLVLKS